MCPENPGKPNLTLGSNVENAALFGSATSLSDNELDKTLVGNALANTLSGGFGNDVLDGAIGADIMIGGIGDDQYFVDNAGDTIVENTGEGVDTVVAGLDYALGANAEDLVLTGTTNLSGTGNALNNQISGNSGSNVLAGAGGNDALDGGADADTMSGGIGSDTYVVDNVGDVVVELSGEGVDTVRSSIGWTLSANVENLNLTGTSAINGTGNSLGNVIQGNSSNNILNGQGGDGSLFGGLGNDEYLFGRDFGADIVVENDGTSGNCDKTSFGADITEDQLWFQHFGNDLKVSIIGTTDVIILKDWYSDSAHHVEKFLLADWRYTTDTQIENLVQAMAAFTPPAVGQATLPQNYQDVLAPVIAANWQ